MAVTVKKQQGDVILRKISELPITARLTTPKQRGWVVAEGETTGHAHVLEPTVEDQDLGIFEADGVLYIKTSGLTKLVHEEHGPISLEPGVWKVGIVQEFDPFSQDIRDVRD